MSETSWDAIRTCARNLFGAEPNLYQIRLWWFGGSATLDTVNQTRWGRRKWAQDEIGPWESVIKLALRWSAAQVKKSGRRLTNTEIWKLV